jgi:hypothetical protein
MFERGSRVVAQLHFRHANSFWVSQGFGKPGVLEVIPSAGLSQLFTTTAKTNTL